MVALILSTLVWIAIAVTGIRIFAVSGGVEFRNKKLRFLCRDLSQHSGFSATSKEVGAVFGISFLFRIIVLVISAFAIFIVTNDEFSIQKWIEAYMKWDANNYYRIAKGGYSYYMEDGAYTTLVFFPLYPWLIRVLYVIFRNYTVSGIILSSLLYSGACAVMYKLFAMDYNKQTVIRAIVYISIYPHSFFFGVMMNESMLLFTAVLTLYFIRKRKWVGVGIFGALAALSRMAGLLLAFPAAVEWLERYKIIEKLRNKQIKEVWKLFYKKGLWIFLMLAGTGIYLYCNYALTGDWFKFTQYQERFWHQGSTYFGKGINLIWDYVIHSKEYKLFSLWMPQLISIIFTIVILIYGLRKTPNMYTTFLIATIILNTGLKWPLSIARYMTCAVPAFVILSDFSERHKWTEPIITATMAITFGVFFVGYFMSRQIM